MIYTNEMLETSLDVPNNENLIWSSLNWMTNKYGGWGGRYVCWNKLSLSCFYCVGWPNSNTQPDQSWMAHDPAILSSGNIKDGMCASVECINASIHLYRIICYLNHSHIHHHWQHHHHESHCFIVIVISIVTMWFALFWLWCPCVCLMEFDGQFYEQSINRSVFFSGSLGEFFLTHHKLLHKYQRWLYNFEKLNSGC